MDYLFYVFGTLIFVAVVLAIEGGFIAWNSSRGPEAARIARRLRAMSAKGGESEQASMIRQRQLAKSPQMQALLEQMQFSLSLDNYLAQSGLRWNVGYLLCLMAGIGAGGMLLAALFGQGWIGSALAACLGLLPLLYVRRARSRRLRKFEAQLPDALDMMGRALRAGHAFPTALKMVGEEMSAPLCEDFKLAFDEVNFGISMQDALVSLSARVPVTDLRFFVIAVVIQRETGGNLAELLANISGIMRDRIKLFAQVRVLSAEGKMSAWVLSLLPFAAALMIHISNPAFLEVLYTDPVGRMMIGGALFMMFVGVLVMRNIINIKV
ncbi:type II secretion system F family protein [Massilia sp. CF038]|uniref:type II secretion system F family protein n=1 Tax=Massilia sp. CF038 TaxID=1881045 RepID=UPI000922F9B6|nr:type II secretion system F family protein [Massilia sp. CF038]SHG50336.1 tight adherence protein B [Massilia sp. CF038]